MASLAAELWESIFTPGPTPPLLRAANASFAALQLVLAALLFATASAHLVVLSALCAGLWWAINWFAAELAVAQQQQQGQQGQQGQQQGRPQGQQQGQRTDAGPDSSDTEVEGRGAAAAMPGSLRRRAVPLAPPADVSPTGTRSSASTEDEWEKVSAGERDKVSAGERDRTREAADGV